MNQSKTLFTHVALLRGVNVGARNRLPMRDLAQMFVEEGAADVITYIQSGNVIFRAAPRQAEKLPSLIAKRIAEVFGYKVPVVLRAAGQLRETVENNPYLKAGAAEAGLFVYFLASPPDAPKIAALDPDRSPPDTFVVRGRDVYVQLATGVADTKLTNAYFDSKLATTSTARNWRTVLKLLELVEG